MAAERDVALKIVSLNVSAERRITPTWSLAQLKAKLEPITGIPPASQKLVLRVPGVPTVALVSHNEDEARLSDWNLVAQAEIEVEDTRPPGHRNLDLTDLSAVPKYTMPEDEYAARSSTILAWKKANKLGRFNPSAPSVEREKLQALWDEVEARQIAPGKRCQLGQDSARRGSIAFVGEVPEIPGLAGPWVGIVLDEPMGKNDGSVGSKKYFECRAGHGVFVRPEKVEVGEFGVLLDEDDEHLEEI